MLKKMVIVSSVAAVAMLGVGGMAWADDAGDGATNCTSDDVQHQSNKGDQVLGGNLSAQDIQGNVLGAQATRPAGICPSVANNNHL